MAGAALSGVVPILSMPFDERERIDEDGLRAVAEFAVRAGARAVGFGFGSEIDRLTDAERERAIQVVAPVVQGRVPLIAATGAGSTAAAVQRSERAAALGASMVMVTPPPRADADGILAYYRAIGELGVGIMVQDAPTMTGVPMPPSLQARLVEEVPRITALKLEAAPSAPKIAAVRALVGERVAILGGMGGTYLLGELAAGAVGTMPGVAFPEMFAAVCARYASGDIDGAAALFNRYLPLLVWSGQGIDLFLWVQKEILRRGGIIRSARVRSPAAAIDAASERELDRLLAGLELLALAGG